MERDKDNSEKTFDCVEMKRQAQEAVERDLAGLTREQLIEHWRMRSEEFQRELEAAKAGAVRKAS